MNLDIIKMKLCKAIDSEGNVSSFVFILSFFGDQWIILSCFVEPREASLCPSPCVIDSSNTVLGVRKRSCIGDYQSTSQS